MKELTFGYEKQRKRSVPSRAIASWTFDKAKWIFDRKSVSNSIFYCVVEYIVFIVFLQSLSIHFFFINMKLFITNLL